MINTIKKIIKSRSGASITFALLFFLVAAMVSVTVVSAAVTAMRRQISEQEKLQAQLTLETVAEMIGEGLKGTTGVVNDVRTYAQDDTSLSSDLSRTLSVDKTTGNLAGMISPALTYISTYGGSSYASSAMSIDISDLDIEEQMFGNGDISISYTMVSPSTMVNAEEVSDQYDITMTLTLNASSGESYTAILNADSSLSATSTQGNITQSGTTYIKVTTVDTITWKNISISAI